MPHTIGDLIRTWSENYLIPESTIVDLEKASREDMDYAIENNENHYPSELKRIESLIDYLTDRLYNNYQIAKLPPYKPFKYRLRDWINNVKESESQQTLFKLVPKIFYVGEFEFHSLYQSALNGPISKWLIDEKTIDITRIDSNILLKIALEETWFGAMTDSMKLTDFFHINRLKGDLKPEFRFLYSLSKSKTNDAQLKENLLSIMRCHDPQYARIVLLEDFIGTGIQAENTIEWLLNVRPDNPIPILLCPLIISKSGFTRFINMKKKYPHFSFEPVLTLDESVILSKTILKDEDDYNNDLRKIVHSTFSKVKGTNSNYLIDPFGFGSREENGGLIFVMYSNCPDNTLPLIHNESNGPWCSLFPRSSRQ